MHVAQLLDAFVFRPYVEVVEPFLSNLLRDVIEKARLRGIAPPPGFCENTPGESQFEGLHHRGRVLSLGLADQQVDVLGHDNVSGDS